MALRTLRSLLSHGAPVAPCRRSNGRRMLTIQNFKEDEKPGKKESEKTELHYQAPGTGGPQAEHGPEKKHITRRKKGELAGVGSAEMLPFRRMTDAMNMMQREMEALMQTMGSPLGMLRSPFSLMESMAPDVLMPAIGRMMPLDIDEDDKQYMVRLEVPGFSKNDIKIVLDPDSNMVTITGDRTVRAGGRANDTLVQSETQFTRSFILPKDIDHTKEIVARTEHGMLTLTLPKAPAKQQPRAKEIPIRE